MNQLAAPIIAMAHGPSWKWFTAGAAGFFAWLHPIEAMRTAIITTLCLMLFDLFLGIYASFVEGRPIQSSKLMRTGAKCVVYILFPAAVYWGLRALGLTDFAAPSATAIAVMSVGTELVSIIENIHRGKLIAVPEWLITIIKGKVEELQHKETP